MHIQPPVYNLLQKYSTCVFSLEAWWHCQHVWQGTENKRLFQRVTDFYKAKMRHCD